MLKENLHKPVVILVILYFLFLAFIVGANVPFALMLIFAGISYFLSFRIKLRAFGAILFVLAFLIRLSYILWIKTPPISDFQTLLGSAIQFSNGDYSFSELRYFYDWAYQTGFVIYEGLIAKIVGTKILVPILSGLNALFSSGICLLTYRISRNFTGEEVARFGSLMTIGMMFPVAFSSVLSNQHIATFFALLALFFLIDKRSLKLHGITKSLIAGLSLAISNIMRPEIILIIGAILGFYLIQMVRSRKEVRKSLSLKIISVMIVYLLVNTLASKMIIDKGINREGLRNNNPLWKFVVGLNFDTHGSFSHRDENIVYDANITLAERRALEMHIIRERLKKGPKILISLFISKFQLLWGRDPMLWSYKHLLEAGSSIKLLIFEVPFDRIADLFFGIHNLQMFFLVVLSLTGALLSFKTGMEPALLIFYLILLASAGVYAFTEVQERYLYLQQAILVIPAIYGMELIKTRLLSRVRIEPVKP